MKIYSLYNGFLIRESPEDPYQIIENFFMGNDYNDIREELLDMVLAASTTDKSDWIRESPGHFLWRFQEITSLVLAVYLIVERKLYKSSTAKYSVKLLKRAKRHSSRKTYLPWSGFPVSLDYDELRRPYKVFTQVFGLISLEVWMEYFYFSIENGLSWKYPPNWYDVKEQVPCTIYLFKILDAAYLIYINETKFGKKYHRK